MAIRSKLKAIALAALLAASTGAVSAQDFSIRWNPRSGDVWIDSQLDDVNRYGARYRDPFVDEMARHYGAPRALVNELLVTRRWAPGDIYYACSIAQTLGRPCRYVVEEWERNHAKGWGVVARDLGIKPGSAEFHRLKRGFVPTYDRWARPITIDHDLRKDFPNRGNAVKAGRNAPGKARAAPGKVKAKGDDQSKGSNGKGNNGKGQDAGGRG